MSLKLACVKDIQFGVKTKYTLHFHSCSNIWLILLYLFCEIWSMYSLWDYRIPAPLKIFLMFIWRVTFTFWDAMHGILVTSEEEYVILNQISINIVTCFSLLLFGWPTFLYSSLHWNEILFGILIHKRKKSIMRGNNPFYISA